MHPTATLDTNVGHAISKCFFCFLFEFCKLLWIKKTILKLNTLILQTLIQVSDSIHGKHSFGFCGNCL